MLTPRPFVRLDTPAASIALDWPTTRGAPLTTLQRRVYEWTHVVRNRTRWNRSKDGAAEQDARAREFLTSLGVGEAELAQLSQAGMIRVSVGYTREDEGWEARILPWEFILSAATRGLRQGPLVVTRWLRSKARARQAPLGRVLFVESAPGRLAQAWDFSDEARLVGTYSGADCVERLVSPTLKQLGDKVRTMCPGIIHLAGFDAHLGLKLLNKDGAPADGNKAAADTRDAAPRDGYLLVAAGGGAEVADAQALADALVPPTGEAPALVFCNIWNSAARIAPMLVAAGAGAAIGLQDDMDDALAEIFLGSFYRGLAEGRQVEAGFDAGWTALLMQRRPLRGSGIILWRGGSDAPVPEATQERAAASGAPTVADARATAAPDIDESRLADTIAFKIEPVPQLSYGLLHNNRDLFRSFSILNLQKAPLRGLEVHVELHANDGGFPWRQVVSLDDPVLDLRGQIRIALTSELARGADELIRTSLYVRVRWRGLEVFSQTFAVTLLPVDQWADTDEYRAYLPSYVFPRDAAVTAVLRHAEPYVTALRDDPGAGFDGYQSVDPSAAEPAAAVDRQVQALWYALIQRMPPGYINPPPTYAVAAQRIRTPSDITQGGFGTCIDLALMLAACLEAVEIHPVIVLLNDHAFVGYWRTEEARTAFLRNAPEPDGAASLASASASGSVGAPWSFGRDMLARIQRAVRDNRLVPIEAVGLTGRWSLGEATEAARAYLRPAQADRFLTLFDLRFAREHGVTPLPLGPSRQR